MIYMNLCFPDYTNPCFSDAKITTKNEVIKDFKKWSKVYPKNPYIKYFAQMARKANYLRTYPKHLKLPDSLSSVTHGLIQQQLWL